MIADPYGTAVNQICPKRVVVEKWKKHDSAAVIVVVVVVVAEVVVVAVVALGDV